MYSVDIPLFVVVMHVQNETQVVLIDREGAWKWPNIEKFYKDVSLKFFLKFICFPDWNETKGSNYLLSNTPPPPPPEKCVAIDNGEKL